MPRHEVNSVNDVGPRTGALAVEHTHTEEAHLFGHAESSTADDAGHVRAVPVAVHSVTFMIERVIDAGCTIAKFIVREENASIDDIGIHALTIVVIRITIIKRQRTLINAVKSP